MEHEFFERMGNTVDKLVQYVGELQSARKDNLNTTDDHTQQILPVLRQLEEEAIDTIRAINEEVIVESCAFHHTSLKTPF